nr:FecR domain-containing protein [Chloroflexota bacterium]
MRYHEVHFTNLVDWVDNRLDPERRQRLEKHLAGCPACRRDLAWLQRVIHAARSDDTVEPPAEAVARVKALYHTKAKAIAAARTSRVWPTIRVPRLAFAFALTLVLLVSVVLYLTQVPTLFAHAAMLTTVVGSTQARHMGEAQWQEIGAGGALCEGDAVRVVDGVALLILFDGSALEMQAGSELAFSSLRSGLLGTTYQIVLQQTSGSVDYNVASLRSSRCLFEVQAPTARVAVRGTRFVVAVQSREETHVAVLQGSVQVISAMTTTVLAEREVAIVPANAPLVYLPTLTPLPTPEPTAIAVPSPQPSLTAHGWAPSATPTPEPTVSQLEGIPQTPTMPHAGRVAYPEPSHQRPSPAASSSITPTLTVSPWSSQVHFRGIIESFPHNLLGLWTISGQSVLVTPRAEITGTPAVGRQVIGIALAIAGHPLVALQMEIEEVEPRGTVPPSPRPGLGLYPTRTSPPSRTIEPGSRPSPAVTVPPIRTPLPIATILPHRTPAPMVTPSTAIIPPRRTPIPTATAPPTPSPQPTASPGATITPEAIEFAEATPKPEPTTPTGIGPRADR